MDIVLHNAAISGDIGILEQNKDKLVSQVTPRKNSVLHLACQSGKTECVRWIISEHPSLLHKKNSNKDSALHIAVRNGHYGIAMALMEFVVRPDEELETGVVQFLKKLMLRMRNMVQAPKFLHANNVGETPLYIAAEKGYEDLVAMILKISSSPPYSGSYSRTALHGAIISNSEGNTRILLKWKESLIKETDENGWSPLYYATFLGYDERVLQLLDVDKSSAYDVDNDGNTCLHIAAYRGLICVSDALILQCPDCWEIENSRRENILHFAAKNQQASFISHILREYTTISNTLITKTDVDGNTPLSLLADSNCFVPELSTMVDKNALNSERSTPLGIVNDNDSSHIDLVKGELLGVDAHLSLPKAISTFRDKSTINKEKAPPTSRTEPETEKLRRTADTIMIVAALITSVTFTAGFTMPGGYYQSSDKYPGMAVLSKNQTFLIFIVSDAIALTFSVTAIFFNFWGILHESEQTLRWSTQVAVYPIIVAIAHMLLAFGAGISVVLAQSGGVSTKTIVISVVPVNAMAVFLLIITLYWVQLVKVFSRLRGPPGRLLFDFDGKEV